MTDYLEVIRDKISILDVISKEVKLTKKGREYLGLCPFHGEKTPSFYVNPQKGFYYCFGCQVKGNIFNFYMDYYKLSFQDSLEELAKMAGISLPENKYNSDFNKNNDLYNLCVVAKNYFIENLTKDQRISDYLTQRNLLPNIVKQFELGFASKNNHELWKKLEGSSFYEEDILEIGLKGCNDKGELYEFFRERLIFPIKNVRGKIIAFGGRVLGDKLPKYLNTKESKIFSKKNNLYGLYESIKNLDKKNLLIVEGYMDVIALHQKGFNTAVATLGTSITKNHLELIAKYDNEPVFCLDGDSAGYKSSMKVIDLYLEDLKMGVNPRFIFLSDNQDPDNYVNNNSKEKFEELITQAISISEVLLLNEIRNKNLEIPEVALMCFSNLRNKVLGIKDSQLQNSFLNFFRSNTIYAYRRKNLKNKQIKSFHTDRKLFDADVQTAGILLFCVIAYPNIFLEVEEKLAMCNFANKDLEKLRLFLLDKPFKIDNEGEYCLEDIPEGMQEYCNNILEMNLVKPIISKVDTSEKALDEFNNAFVLVEKKALEESINQIKEKLRNIISYEDLTNDKIIERVNKLNLEKIEIQKYIQNIMQKR